MKYLAWLLVSFAVAVVISSTAHNPAYVLLVYPPYRIDMSLTLFVVLSLLALLAIYSLVQVVMAAAGLPAKARRYREQREHEKSQALLNTALNAYFEGRYAAAEKAAVHAMELGEASSLHSILAASSAHELREYQKRDEYLTLAQGKDVGDSTMRLMATTRFMLDQHEPQAALDALQALRVTGVKSHLGVLSLELKAQQQAGHWDEVLDIVQQLEARQAIDMTVAAQLRQQAYLESLRAQQSAVALGDLVQRIPAEYLRRTKIAATAARALLKFADYALAQKVIANSLDVQWDSELVSLYGDNLGSDLSEPIAHAENWLVHHPEDAGLLLALGKLCMHQQLWAKAQSYLERSIAVSPSYTAYTALALLSERLGKSEQTYHYHQLALALRNPAAA